MGGKGEIRMSTSITFSVAGAQADALKEKVREEATKAGMSMSEWITEAVAEKLRASHDA